MLFRRFLCTVSALASVASVANLLTASSALAGDGSEGTVTETLRLKHIAPSGFIFVMAGTNTSSQGQEAEPLMPRGIERLMPDEAAWTLTVRGTPEGVNRLREMARLMDVASRRVLLPLRILRYTYSETVKAPAIEEVGALTANGTNNATLRLTAFGDGSLFNVEVTPHINGDDSVSIRAALSIQTPGEKPSQVKMAKVTNFRRILPGKRAVVTGTALPGVLEAAGIQEVYLLPPDSLTVKDKPATLYYLEAAPQVLALPAAVSTAAR